MLNNPHCLSSQGLYPSRLTSFVALRWTRFCSLVSFWDCPTLDAVCQMQSNKCQEKVDSHFSQSTVRVSGHTGQDAVGLFCCEGTLLAYIHLVVHQRPLGTSPQSCLPASLSPAWVVAGDSCFPGAGLGTSHWMSWSSCWLILLACLVPSEWQPCSNQLGGRQAYFYNNVMKSMIMS